MQQKNCNEKDGIHINQITDILWLDEEFLKELRDILCKK